MEKNAFLLYNDIVSALYHCSKPEDLRTLFLPRLKSLIPYSYASIFLADTKKQAKATEPQPLLPALCVPASFAEAENNWLEAQDEDYLAWLTKSPESILVRESEILSDEQRLNSYLYQNCYKQYNIYDTLQYAIAADNQCLGIITLLRTRIDDKFCDDDSFFLRSFGIHLSMVFKKFTYQENDGRVVNAAVLEELTHKHSLTPRESQVYRMVLSFADNQQICDSLGIKENTLQKHLQNLFQKLGVSSRWEAAAVYYR